MKKRMAVTLWATMAVSLLSAQVRKEIYLNKGWSFQRGDIKGAEQPDFNDQNWQKINIPHDWAITGPFDKEIDKQTVAITQNGETIPSEKTGRTGALPYIGVGWYRTTLPKESLAGRRASIIFDGAMSEARVYINGKEVGFWPYGYNSFHFDITPFLGVEGENVLAVRLENQPESSRWYPGAGLYRPVRLLFTNETAVVPWGLSVTTPVVSDSLAQISIKAELNAHQNKKLRTVTTVLDQKSHVLLTKEANLVWRGIPIEENLILERPALWSPERPALYLAKIELYDGDRLVDVDSVRFGIREVKVNAHGGFMLNGKSRKIKGVCLHHDLGPLGAAINKAALKRQLLIMKEMGADAIRTAHNMPSPWQMELCDELGLMVMAESFDEWKAAKCKNGYNRFFDQWAERDLVNLIRCHRNHPSIVMWSIGNEVPEQSMDRGNRIAKRLQDICHREDPTRPVTIGMDRVDNAIANNFAALLDVPGLNYRTHRYQIAYDKLPQGFILGSETASTVSSRGVYKYPVQPYQQKTYPDAQSSSYDLESCSWSNLPEEDWELQDDKPWVIGEFVWTGFDYLGEPTPYDQVWPSRSSYFGICDLAGLPKDRYYLYRSKWNQEAHTLHLLPHWTWSGKEGDTIPVYCYTDFPEAELFVNGVSQGRIKKNPASKLDRYRLRWNKVVYQPGTLKVVAYNENGAIAQEKEVHTAGKPSGLRLSADRNQLIADGVDLSFITVEVIDSEGNLCPDAAIPLSFTVEGSGSFKAVCNGDATSLEPFQIPQMKTFNGKLVFIVQAAEKKGAIRVKVSGAQLKSERMTLEVE
ncbi:MULTISPECIES: glycoside hydrolase family 2 TIM barrel-domain containing protein [Olivibacter]|uniref:Glycoside hydrolase family 2 TIM barrel-domain containing protein n=1 Tax=Olivibacter jilunii TaxID=985016 RepID=A0ABW6B040_9SPHI|nr:glycoside hydrolase family 2 TIM barrel-domain containing protein [Pseudosphingobacterium sp.]